MTSENSATVGTTLEPISIDYNDYGVDSQPKTEDLLDACVQYSAMGKIVPYHYMDYMAKIILEVDEDKVELLSINFCFINQFIDFSYSLRKCSVSCAKWTASSMHW